MKYLILLLAISILLSCYPDRFGTHVTPNPPPVPPPINEEVCNFILGGDCGTFEQNIEGISSQFTPPWVLFHVDTFSYEGFRCIKAEKTTLIANDTIILADDSIEVDSGIVYHLFAYINVEHAIEEDDPEIMMGYAPGGDIIFQNTTWGRETGQNIWLRIILTFRATKNKNIRAFIYEKNIASPNGKLFIDKFKLIHANSNDENKCCEFVLPNSHHNY